MGDVTGPISTLPGRRHELPEGTMCDVHPDRAGGPDDVDYGVCPACDGKREVEVECEPITIFDLENAEWY